MHLIIFLYLFVYVLFFSPESIIIIIIICGWCYLVHYSERLSSHFLMFLTDPKWNTTRENYININVVRFLEKGEYKKLTIARYLINELLCVLFCVLGAENILCILNSRTLCVSCWRNKTKFEKRKTFLVMKIYFWLIQ